MNLRPKTKNQTRDQAERQIRDLLEKRGRRTLELARQLMLEDLDDLRCKEVKDALRYFACEYWTDLARPTLMSLSCEAVGGNYQMTMPVAIPIMLLTGGIDIHDDIIDESRKKNGRLTVYGKFGKDIALLAGDAFMFKGFTRLQLGLSQFNKDKTSKIPRILEETFFELGDAEASELALKASLQVDPEEYLRIVKKKGADVEAYTHIGAILGDGSNDEILALCKYGRILGMLAILRDDVIDAMNSAELTRRLKHEIAPLPVLYAAQTSETKSMINSILVKENRTKKDNERIVEIVNGSGGFTQTKKKMVELMDEGFKSLEPIHHRRRELKLLLNIGRTL